ncbi:four helix bundle protein [Candidatus Kaiserbacteria bacterium]|nr:four helix bundle protein [Candidatus Kaiserbacteria bacterium]
MQTFRDLVVWQKAVELAKQIYILTHQFPTEERFGLASQMQRAAVSIPSNIAEGKLRGSSKEFIHFLRVAFGSGGELETQIEIAKRLPRTAALNFASVEALLDEIMRMLNAMISGSGHKLAPRA